ncbi:MAG: peptidylprolyl isomerase [Candidatus Krumholzibacteria bacterium]|nr:peptidylprolyl isomerase [Candidatus Krumholzibacteria bacterium]
MTRKTLMPAVALAVSFLAAGCGGTKTDRAAQAEKADSMQQTQYIARVNGAAVTAGDLDQEVTMLKQQMQGRVSEQQLGAMDLTMRQQATANLVNRLLLTQEADRRGISVTAEQVDGKYAEIRSNFPSEEAFNQQLERSSMTAADLRAEVERGMRLEALIEERTAGLGDPTDGEVREFYDSNIERFSSAERVRASHVLIMVEEGDTEDVKRQKRERIEDVHRRLLSGEDIAPIAQAESDCPSKSKGGDLGFFGRGQMVKPFEDAAFALSVGGISPVVETKFGYHVIKLTEKEPAGVMPFDEIRGNILDYLREMHRQEEMQRFVTELREAATIEYADSALVGGM